MKTWILISALTAASLAGVAAEEKGASAPAPDRKKPATDGVPILGDVPVVGRLFRPVKVTLNLDQVPFRTAARLLGEAAGKQTFFSGDVPDLPVTLNVKDQDFHEALRMLVEAAGQTRTLSYNVTGDRVEILANRGGRSPAPPVFRVVNLRHAAADQLAAELPRVAPEGVSVVAMPRTNSLLIRGTEAQLGDVLQLIEAIDSPSAEVKLRCEVQGRWFGRSGVFFAQGVTTVAGQEAMVEEGTTDGSEGRYNFRATVVPVEKGLFAVTHSWHVSVPLSGRAKSTHVEKRISATTRIPAGKPVVVGELDAAPYGGMGKLIFTVVVEQAPAANAR